MYSYDSLRERFLDGERKMNMAEVVNLLNKDLRNVTYRYSIFDGCITENYEPISVNNVLDLLNGADNDFEVSGFDEDVMGRLEELEEENRQLVEENTHLRNKFRIFANLMENAFNLLKDEKEDL